MTVMEVPRDRVTDIDGDREELVAVAFSSDRDFATPPVDAAWRNRRNDANALTVFFDHPILERAENATIYAATSAADGS